MSYEYGNSVNIAAASAYSYFTAGISVSVSYPSNTQASVTITGVCNYTNYTGYSPTYINIKQGSTLIYESGGFGCTGTASGTVDGTPSKSKTVKIDRKSSNQNITFTVIVKTAGLSTASEVSKTVSISKIPISKMGAPTISNDTENAKRGSGKMVISWKKGTENGSSVSNYVFEQKKGSGSWTATTLKSTVTSQSISIPKTDSVGTKYQFRVYQKSSEGPNYDSGYSSTVTVTVASNPPTITLGSYSPSSKISPYNNNKGGTVKFVATLTNPSGGTLSIKSVSSGWTAGDISSKKATISRTLKGTSGTTSKCTVTVSDGVEEASATSAAFTINTPPNLTSLTFSTPNKYTGSLPSGVSAFPQTFKINTANISNKTGCDFFVEYCYSTDNGSTWNNWTPISGTTPKAQSTIYTCNSYDDLKYTNRGRRFKVRAKAYDGYDSSGYSNEVTYMIPFLVKDVVVESGGQGYWVDPAQLKSGKVNFGTKVVTTKWENPTVDAGYADLSDVSYKYYFKKADGTTGQTTAVSQGKTAGAEKTYELDIPKEYEGGQVYLAFTVTDVVGNTNSTVWHNYPIVKSPSFYNTTTLGYSYTPTLPPPTSSKGGLSLAASNLGSIDTTSGKISVYFNCPHPNNSSEAFSLALATGIDYPTGGSEGTWNWPTPPNTYSMDLSSISEMASWTTESSGVITDGYWNSRYENCYFSLKIEDEFEHSAIISSSPITINYEQKPIVNPSNYGLVYDQSWSGTETSAFPTDDITTTITSNGVVVQGETLVYQATVTDNNGIGENKDKITYDLLAARGDSSSSLVWQEAPLARIVSAYPSTASTTDSRLLTYKFPYVNEPVFYKFKVRATDSTGLWAESAESSTINLVPVNVPPITNFSGKWTESTTASSYTTFSFTQPIADSQTYAWATPSRYCPQAKGTSIGWSANPSSLINYGTDEASLTSHLNITTPTATSAQIYQADNTYYQLVSAYAYGVADSNSRLTSKSASKLLLVYTKQPLISYRDGYLGINTTLSAAEATSKVLMRIDPSKRGGVERSIIVFGKTEEDRISVENLTFDCGDY